MSVETLALPRLGETMETGRVAGWLKKPGDSFRRGETIVEIESDKTVVELPALADGTLVEIIAAEGADIDVGAPLCTFDDGKGSGEPAPAEIAAVVETAVSEQPVEAAPDYAERPLAAEAGGASAPAPAIPAAPPSTPPAASSPRPETGRSRATPLARRLARDNSIALDGLRGTGRRGRIEARDVRSYGAASSGAAAAGGGDGLAARSWGAQTADRPTVVLLHGFAGDAQTWAGLGAALSRRGLHVVAPDLPGHGATTRDASDVGAVIEGAVAFLAGVDGPIELVGHSLGGPAAVACARAYPDRVIRLTLLAPAGLGTEIDADFVNGMATAGTPGLVAHLLRRLANRPPVLSGAQLDAIATALGAGRLAGIAASIAHDGRQAIDIVPELAALSVPTRIVWGLDDRVIPWRHVLQAPSRVALHLVRNAGHMPHWDQPGEIAALFD